MSNTRHDFFDYSPIQLSELLAQWGEPAFRKDQVIAAAWTPGTLDFSQARFLKLDLRRRLDAFFYLPAPADPETVRLAPDGTRKAVFLLADQSRIESVAIPKGDRLTFCLSSQVGCSLGCRFCATARLGFSRNLTAGEIIAQIRGLSALLGRRPSNLVLMGMGEPLKNLNAVRSALEQLGHSKAWSWSPHKTVVSTSGWLPGLEILARQPLPAYLAFSLNAADDEQRSDLMPVNRRFPLSQVLRVLRTYARKTGESLTIEYVLLAGINDHPEDAARLARLLKNIPVKMNLIPFNPVAGLPFGKPDAKTIAAFSQILRREHMLTTLRTSRGTEIGAACGQLAGQTGRRAA